MIQPTPGRPTMFYEFGPTTDIFHQLTGIGQKSKQAIPYEYTEKPLTHSDKPYTKSGKPYTKSDKPITRSDKLYKPDTSTFTHTDKPYRQITWESLGNGTVGNGSTRTPSSGEPLVSERKDETSQYRGTTGSVSVWNATKSDSCPGLVLEAYLFVVIFPCISLNAMK